MKYEPLIRQLVYASRDAHFMGSEIDERLAYRCQSSTDIVRRTLMNTVCDPRFKIIFGAFVDLPESLSKLLYSLAQSIDSSKPTEAEATAMMDLFLNDLIRKYWTIGKDNDQLHVKKTYKVIQKGVNFEAELDKLCEELGKLPMEDKEGSDEESNNLSPSMLQENENDSPHCDIGHGGEVVRQVENRFMRHLPPSLYDLVKLIGRAGDDDMLPQGGFPVASKSDISGIMTGNEISCMLPSELAILADKKTENVFYERYATRRLQVFSSQSGGFIGQKKHQDGPIIICLDSSGSMAGEPTVIATAVTMAICIIAKRMHRPVQIVKYSDSSVIFRVKKLNDQKKEILRFLSTSITGGNNEDEMFRNLFTRDIFLDPEWKTADILCVSDFGWGSISHCTFNLIKKQKENGMRFYGLNIGSNYTEDEIKNYFASSPVSNVCDFLWVYTDNVFREIKDVNNICKI